MRNAAREEPMSDTQTMSVTPLDAPAGARVTGVDLSQPLSHENGEGILDALAEHGVLVFPDQNLTPAQQVEFSRL
ncbi:MAG TPA: taurine dioxygenase, partial [Rhodospirillaceae bacterium]|nr:taurine dioxygenase [Rhodospirillaceae bacterium]